MLRLLLFIISINFLNTALSLNEKYLDINGLDTIDYGSKRMYLDVPEISISSSNLIIMQSDEGFIVVYPFIDEHMRFCSLSIDYTIWTYNKYIFTNDFDEELWNTLNDCHVGSRCFIKDGLYYRVDRFSDGLEIYYEHVPKDLFNVINKIIKSISIEDRNDNVPFLNLKKRRTLHLK